jgi:hypothetical protein
MNKLLKPGMAVLCAVALAALLSAGAWGQEKASGNGPAARHVWMGPNGKPLPFQSDEEVLEFLKKARITSRRGLPVGITQPSVLELERNGVRAKAHFNEINEEKPMAELISGKREINFRDCHKFNGAAYELSRMLGLDNVPPAVERFIQGRSGSVSIWVENAMTERERLAKRMMPPDAVRWTRQLQVMRVFDNLIYNTDRTQENMLIDADWKLWMIDHTRAFRRWGEMNAPDSIKQVERTLWEKLQQLDKEVAKKRLRPYLTNYEIEAIFKRRDKIVTHIQQMIAEQGEDKVLFRWE